MCDKAVVSEQLDILRRIAERGLTKSQSPTLLYNATCEVFLDLFAHILSEIEITQRLLGELDDSNCKCHVTG
jgi:hypothetical protein